MRKLDDENNHYSDESDGHYQQTHVCFVHDKIVGTMVVDIYIGTCEIVRIVSNQRLRTRNGRIRD